LFRYLVNRRRARSNLTRPSGFVASHSIPCWSSGSRHTRAGRESQATPQTTCIS
jgi:hypothetical protein